MIRFFRVNDPYRLIFVLAILVIIRLVYGIVGLPLSIPELKGLLLGEWLASGFSMYSETFDYTAPLSAWTYQLLDFLFGRSRTSHWVFSTILIFIQAALFNRTLLKNKVFPESNYVVAYLYVIFSIATFDFFALSPQLMSLTWVIISMDHLIRKMDNIAGDQLFLYPGFYLGLAGLFYLPSIVFFLVFFVALVLITRVTLRRIMLFVYGWMTAYLIIILVLYLDGGLMEFWGAYFVEIVRDKIFYMTYLELLQWTLLPLIAFIVALFKTLGKREGSLHAKTQQFMILVFLASIGVLLISGSLSGIELVFFIPVFTFFIANYFLYLKRKFWRWAIPQLMILGSVAAPFIGLTYGSFSNDLVVTDWENPDLEGKKIMIIGGVSPAYLNGKIASPFLDKEIGMSRIEDLNYYQKAPVFLDIFRKANPDLVIDELGVMEKVQFRFPEIEQMNIEIQSASNN